MSTRRPLTTRTRNREGGPSWPASLLAVSAGKRPASSPATRQGRSLLQEVCEQPFALFGEEALGMILHAFEGPGLVPHAHDLVLVGPGGDLVLWRQRPRAD